MGRYKYTQCDVSFTRRVNGVHRRNQTSGLVVLLISWRENAFNMNESGLVINHSLCTSKCIFSYFWLLYATKSRSNPIDAHYAMWCHTLYSLCIQSCWISRQRRELQNFYQRSYCDFQWSLQCNAIKKVLDKISCYKQFKHFLRAHTLLRTLSRIEFWSCVELVTS